ncbi:MAG: exodeoxyribonuclease VII large subunit [Lachnospiraceae bacterium]|nr:exodeoxyribonuclease VII large subunit [Lachnospiraceae bacterium]
MNKNIYSVEYIITYIKNMFSQDFMLRSVYVRGEVSNVTYHPSGHIYFTMKDKAGTLGCVMYAGKKATGLKFTLKEGQQIICFGSISIYGPRSQYQMLASNIVLDGEGQLYEKYEKLKSELEERGMFAPEYKQPIPKYAKKIGIVTASTGAAIQDIINITKRRNPYVQLYLFPAIVQGDGAAPSIVKAIRALDDYGVDVMIVGRGGGSIEDLWAFNEEIVAEAIFNAKTPIVSAVGHETDTTIADYVADLRAPTPSAAAELTVFSYADFSKKLEDTERTIRSRMTNRIASERLKLDRAKLMVDKLNPVYELNNKRLRLIRTDERLRELMTHILNSKKHEYELLIEQMKALSPLEKLSKGYAYVRNNGKSVKTVADVKSGDELSLFLKDGEVTTVVTNIKAGEL